MARIRTIKPEFWTSEQIVECSTNARLLFIGMWNFFDDGGNHPASIKALKLKILPADNFSAAQIHKLVEELLAHKLLFEYVANGARYWHITGWHHQRIEHPTYKFPRPIDDYSRTIVEESSNTRNNSPPDTDVDVEGSVRGGDADAELQHRAMKKPSLAADASPPIITLPLNDKTEFTITQQQLENWMPLYPAVDIRQQLNNMRGWCLANPAKCKTKNGIMRFVNAWLAKEQNHGGNHGKGGERPDRLLRKFQEISGQLETPGDES